MGRMTVLSVLSGTRLIHCRMNIRVVHRGISHIVSILGWRRRRGMTMWTKI
jgi:hypothetical protein